MFKQPVYMPTLRLDEVKAACENHSKLGKTYEEVPWQETVPAIQNQ